MSFFGNYAVVILDVPEFRRRMDIAITARSYMHKNGQVEYHSPDNPPYGLVRNGDAIFRKSNKYEYQQEYRYAIWNNIISRSPITLEIGDISDIAKQMDSSKVNDCFFRKLFRV